MARKPYLLCMSRTVVESSRHHPDPNGPPPPLENGDVLSAPEFLRRYEAMPDGIKFELIEGVAYMASPVRFRAHDRPDIIVGGWLLTYESATPGVIAGGNATIQLDLENVPQPDALLFIDPECGGQVNIGANDYLVGGPELVVEVSASTESVDTREKARVYRRHGVREYLTVRTRAKAVDWRVLREGDYQLLRADRNGLLHSETFPGLVLDPAALLALDTTRVLTVLNRHLQSPAHQQFIARLAAAKRSHRRK